MITERAMLAAVNISIWTAVKHDRKVGRDVAHQHGAHEGARHYNKQLLRGAERLDALRTLSGQIRQHFYKITLPWSDEGYRLLPAHFYFELTGRKLVCRSDQSGREGIRGWSPEWRGSGHNPKLSRICGTRSESAKMQH